MNQVLVRPNFLFIHTDQQRYDTLGCNGCAVARTPHLDRLAAEGVRFTRCYTTNPVCMPARASYVTGQYPSHHGVWQNGVPLDPRADTLQAALKRGGYHTALIGKAHLDNIWLRKEKHPAYGFDPFIECEGDPYCQDDYFQWLDAQGLYENYMEDFKRGGHKQGYTRDLPADKHMNRWITDHAVAYLDQRARDREPFFLWLGFFDPHHPFDPCEPYASLFQPEPIPMPIHRPGEEAGMTPLARQRFDALKAFTLDPAQIRRTIAAYHAMIAHVDVMVGRLLAALEQNGLADNTVVIFTSDHGEMLGDHGLLFKGPLFYEGAVRVPLIYRLPRRCGLQGVVDDFVSHIDLAPTITRLAGVDGPRLMQGNPLFESASTLTTRRGRDGALVEWREKAFQSNDPFLVARCFITERWKYVHYHDRDFGELYDRERDPQEVWNLWADPTCRGPVAELQRRLNAFMIDSEPCPRRTEIF